MNPKPWSIASLLRLRCPACGADTFRRGLFRTFPKCAACGRVFERETGFFAGAIYPMYGGAAVLGGLAFAGASLGGLSLAWASVSAAGAVVLGSPWLFWYSRLAFLHTDHRFFPE